MGFIEIQKYGDCLNNHPTLCFQGPRGLRGLQGTMGAVGDRVSNSWNAVMFSTLQLLSCKRCKRELNFPCVFLFLSPGLAGLQGKTRHRRHHRQDSESFLLSCTSKRFKKKTKTKKQHLVVDCSQERWLVPSMNSSVCFI